MGFEHVSLALLHYPVYDREGRVVATALTTIDVHDLARLARTYAMGPFFVITPLRSQQELGLRMVRYWTEGPGANYNPTRKEALRLVHFVDSLEDAVGVLEERWGQVPRTVATSAKRWPQSTDYGEMARRIAEEEVPFLILLGTGWGLSEEVVLKADFRLERIEGWGYNHLSVRTAAAIIVDRLLGRYGR